MNSPDEDILASGEAGLSPDEALAPPRPTSMGVGDHPLFAELAQQPGLVELGAALRRRLDPRTLEPKKLKSQGVKLERDHECQRLRFLRQKVRQLAWEKIWMDLELKALDEGLSSEETQGLSGLKESLTVAQLADFIPVLSEAHTPIDVFGLKTGRVIGASARLPDHVRQWLNQSLEDDLLAVCHSMLTQMGHGPIESQAMGSKLERVRHLPDLLRNEKEMLEQFQALAADDDLTPGGLKLLDHLVLNFEILNQLGRDVKIAGQTPIDHTNVKYLALKCKTLQYKVKCLELEIMASTYKPTNLPALKRIRSHLKESMAWTETTIQQVQGSLVQYESAGQKFEDVVVEYTHVMEEIEGKKWALAELKASSS